MKQNNPNITYMPEVDGLRSIAVLLVLLCHMKLAGATGGYIGVDVFFVISGFLITSTLISQTMQGKLSFWGFYGRRFVRLYPALIATVVLSLIAGFLIMDPFSFENLARTGKYAIRSTSNLFFTEHIGYFDVMAPRQPFLHTWSLGVEWQFYLVWPFLIWLTLKFSRRLLPILLVVITVASVLLSQWMITQNPNAAYYQMPYRAFELSIGALLVFIYHKKISTLASIALTLFGVAAMVTGSYIFTDTSPFPGFNALVPCLGAAACIFGAKGFTTGNLFRSRPLVYIGKISYSVYLVHWPLIVLYTYYIFRDPTLAERIGLFIVSLALGAVFYALIEKRITWKRMKHKLAGCLVLLLIAVGVNFLCGYVHKQNGVPERIHDTRFSGKTDYTVYGYEDYFQQSILGNADTQPLAYVTGDSFAAATVTGLHEALSNNKQSARFAFFPGCMISGNYEAYLDGNNQCMQISQKVLTEVKAQKLPLVMIESWGTPLTDHFLLGGDGNFESTEQYTQQITENLDQIHQKIGTEVPLILVGTPTYWRWGGGEQECLRRPSYVPQVCMNIFKDYQAKSTVLHDVNRALEQYANNHVNVYFIDIENQVCPDGQCSVQTNAKLYPDGVHLSRYGSRLVAAEVVKQIQEILNTPENRSYAM